MPEIIVRGLAESLLDPTDATVTVTVQVRASRSQAEAVTTCAQRCEAVDAAVDARRAPASGDAALVRRAVTSSVTTGPEYEHNPKVGRRLVGYTAARTSELHCAPDGPGLTALLSAVSALPDVRVAGPSWRIAPDAEGWVGVRAAAAEEALRRAEAYAAGLDLAVGRVAWVAEPGLRLPGGGGGMESTMAFAAAPQMRMKGGGGGEEEETAVVRIQPEPLLVEVRVEVAFDLT
ncbi:hypothetical protein BH23ACT9_BH23ACT9_12620 [soil metagenome]